MTETAISSDPTADRWNAAAGAQPGTASTGSSTVRTPGNITITGYGDERITGWTGPGSNYAVKERTTVFDGSTGTLSASELKNLFVRMDADSDPFLAQIMTMYGVKDKKVAKAIWDDAADYAVKLAKTGKKVDLMKDVLTNSTFLNTYLSIPKTLLGGSAAGGTNAIQPVQKYLTSYFSKTGKPTAAAQQLLKDQLAKALGHAPTAAELSEYKPLLDAMYQQQKAGLFTKTYNPNTGTSVEAIDPAQWLAQQVTNKHQARVQYGKEGAVQSNADQYAELASDYGFSIYGPDGKNLSVTARDQLAMLDAGKMSIDEIGAQFKQAALAHYAYLKPQFDAGLTLRQIAAPALSAISNVLEKDPNSITVNDSLVQKYLQGVDGKGVMPMYKYEAMLRQDPTWQFTNNARSTFADLSMQIGERFGMVG